METKQYQKVSNTEIKEITEVTNVNERAYTVEQLKAQKISLENDLVNHRKSLDSLISNNEMQIDRINKLLLKAEELGIK
jgi:hypothetical protein